MPQVTRVCTETEFACHSHNECVALEYRCDRRPDCRDMSDELNCGEGLPGAQWPADAREGSGYAWACKSMGVVRVGCRQRGLREVGRDMEG